SFRRIKVATLIFSVPDRRKPYASSLRSWAEHSLAFEFGPCPQGVQMRESKARELSGAVPIIPIPFDDNENIDEEALRRLVEFAVSKGFSGICLPAYLSEFYKLSEPERIHVVKVAVSQAAGRLLVIAQSNHGSSRVALEMARAHVENGADLISVLVPRMFA